MAEIPYVILDKTYTPCVDKMCAHMNEPGRVLWREVHSFVQQQYGVSPKVTYSSCSGKPGWNVKYQKSGKSICTIYPERSGCTVLIVLKVDLVPVIESMKGVLDAEVLAFVRSASPFNGTLWLMVPVFKQTMLEGVKELLLLKAGRQII